MDILEKPKKLILKTSKKKEKSIEEKTDVEVEAEAEENVKEEVDVKEAKVEEKKEEENVKEPEVEKEEVKGSTLKLKTKSINSKISVPSASLELKKKMSLSKSKSKAVSFLIQKEVMSQVEHKKLPIFDYSIESWSETAKTKNNLFLPSHKEFKNFITSSFYKKYSTTGKKTYADIEKNIMEKFNGLTPYQKFISDYMSPENIIRGILVYFGTGTGKTRTAIEVAKSYRLNGIKTVVISPSSLHETWKLDINKWDTYYSSGNNVNDWYTFVSYNASNSVKQIKDAHLDGKLIIIDEAHNLISTLTSPKASRREIYSVLMNLTRVKIICMTATPIINKPYELALLFNILKGYLYDEKGSRCTLFPENSDEFNDIFVNYNTKEPKNDLLFQNRINGLVSYYGGLSSSELFPDLYQEPPEEIVMSGFQLEKYKIARLEEIEKEKKLAKFSHMFDDDFPNTYRSSSRQASDWCFPEGIKRPKPKMFNDQLIITPTLSFSPYDWTIDQVNDLHTLLPSEEEFDEFKKFYNRKDTSPVSKLELLIELLEEHNDRLTTKSNLITDDEIDKFEQFSVPENYKEAMDNIITLMETSYTEYLDPEKKLSECSEKYLAIINNILHARGNNGIILVYSTFTNMEGLAMFSKVLETIGYERLSLSNDIDGLSDKKRYILYTGEIPLDERKKLLNIMTAKNNMHGEKCKIFLGSAAASEGLDLKYIRQVHVIEPHWHEVRIQQVIGRARRYKSHIDLPEDERNVSVFRYHSILPEEDEVIDSTDISIYNLSMEKMKLNNKFLSLLKNNAVDCFINLEKNFDEENNIITCLNRQTKYDSLYHACLNRDKFDAEIAREYGVKDYIYKEIEIKKVKYIIRMNDNGKDYDYFNVKLDAEELKLSFLYNYDIYNKFGKQLEKTAGLIINSEGKKKLVTLEGLQKYKYI